MACSSNSKVRISAFSGEPLSSYDKSDPYISEKNAGSVVVLNHKFQIDGKSIVCSHLSALYVAESMKCHDNGKKLKINDLFGSAESIIRIAPVNIHSLYSNLVSKSCNKYIIVCDRFGVFLHQIAINTDINSQRVFLLRSCSHAMALRVIRKLKTDKVSGSEYSSYVVHFFDPNKTNIIIRSEVGNLDFFLDKEKFSFRNFVGNHEYSQYFERLHGYPKEYELMAYECSNSDIKGSGLLSVLETFLYDGISECALYHLMEGGLCNDSIIMMSEKLSLLPSSIRETVVYGRSSLGIQALHVALTNNNYNSINSYCCFLNALSDDEKIRVLPHLFIASNSNGESGLFMAMQEDRYDSVIAFGGLLDILISLEEKISASELAVVIFNLINARRGGNESATGLFIAMQEGSSAAIFAFGNLLDRLISLSDKEPVTNIAKMVFTILMSFGRGCVTGLFMAMQEGHSSSVYCFGKLLDRLVALGDRIPSDDLEKMVFDILLARSGGIRNGLFAAIRNNHIDSITEYCSLLSRIDKSRWAQLLAANNSLGITGILFASEETIDFYLAILKGFAVDVLSELYSILKNVKYTKVKLTDSGLIKKHENFLLQLEKIINS
ncbi:ShET2/EspL2 family type III secretion system effector toxin [Candidatus Ichthyocystis sparus]|uniref:ShET2/EspL2 family type III secretion system effector toxin n=1 Tax=Candidatus Ichthyocystis sparus TaxID=1561004 RepID=UPI000B89F2E7|nr:ShET2/EspL2 family type III secretion system effector toxin [Candidatus Ichthyocystis sparus]